MRRTAVMLTAGVLLVGCHTVRDHRGTISQLRSVEPDLQEVPVDNSLVSAMAGYRQFLNATPNHQLAPEAMRRLADLQIEKDYGVVGGKGGHTELPAPASDPGEVVPVAIIAHKQADPTPAESATAENDAAFEARATAQSPLNANDLDAAQLPEGAEVDLTGPLQAITTYKKILNDYPWYERNDQVLYQMARAYDELGEPDEAMRVVDRLIAEYPQSKYVDEVHFRRGEYFFVRRKYANAEAAYKSVVSMGSASSFYELALYKLGWSLYKQEFYEEALHQYFALLDYKVSTGYDFDAEHGEEEAKRIEDTLQVVSLSLSNLGGPEVIDEYFLTNGHRGYEDRVYRYFAEFYLTKRRYNDAAAVYRSFVALNPHHAVAPRFRMRVVEIYDQGGFSKLVLESKKEFATRYGLHADYWQYFDVTQAPDVLAYVKSNLKDLANHYHAQYQDASKGDDKPTNFAEATHWYAEFIDSFHDDAETPPMNYQLADLLREQNDFAGAAREYERTAYDYQPHEKAAAAGYAAIFAHREYLKVVAENEQNAAKRATVDSSLKFADTFPQHEHAAVVLGAAAEDLYEMQDYVLARNSAQKLIERFPNADPSVVRRGWLVVAHASFDLADYPQAELAYSRVLAATPENDESRPALIETFAASIYKQGERANDAGDYRAAADHFLRIKQLAPTSSMRAGAEYDAGAALIRLQDWNEAAQVLDDFRLSNPDHALEKEATKQIAFVHREAGELSQAAAEYERVAKESDDPALRAEALLLAGNLYQQSNQSDSALDAYGRYVEQFPKPVETAVETRAKMAGILKTAGDAERYHEQLGKIVQIDAAAGAERTDRTRNVAARAALTLAEPTYTEFAAIELRQPFESSLREKRQDMDAAIKTFSNLVSYEVGDVTAAATFYIAEVYSNFGHSLIESERPVGLTGAKLSDYEDALEDEAFPFEEQAISVHEKNLELIRDGVYNAWTEKSLARLAELKPGRYAKSEISSGFLESIDQYTYYVPERPVLAVESPLSQPSASAVGPDRSPVSGVDATNEADDSNSDSSSASAETTDLETEQYPGVANADPQ
jgi:tetratricopeptide (TPR) repeat protein